jgi:hypothetical protein
MNVLGVGSTPWQGLICKRIIEGVRMLVCIADGDRKNNFGSREDGVVNTSGGFVVIREA